MYSRQTTELYRWMPRPVRVHCRTRLATVFRVRSMSLPAARPSLLSLSHLPLRCSSHLSTFASTYLIIYLTLIPPPLPSPAHGLSHEVRGVAVQVDPQANFEKPGRYHFIGSRVETGRFCGSTEVDSACTAPPHRRRGAVLELRVGHAHVHAILVVAVVQVDPFESKC